MWAGQLVDAGRLELVNVEPPHPSSLRPGQAIIRSTAGGICGSDHPKFLVGGKATSEAMWPRPPGYPLHEIVGEVADSKSALLDVGDCVVGWAYGGTGLAELVVVDDREVVQYNGFEATEAVLIQPLACVIHALKRVDVADRSVAVIGMGPIGAMFAHVAKSMGARLVTGIDPVDRGRLRDDGIVDEFISTNAGQWSRSLSDPGRPNLVIEAVGHQVATLNDAIWACQLNGTVLYFGIPDQDIYPIDMERVMRQDLTVIGGVTRQRWRTLHEAEAYLLAHSDLVEMLITHCFGREELQLAYLTAVASRADRLKVVLSFGS